MECLPLVASFTLLMRFSSFLTFTLVASTSVFGQISDPLPEAIGFGDVTIALETWVTMPASSGGGGGRARLSVMRPLSDGRLFVNDQRGLIYEVEKGSSSLYFEVRDALPNFIDSPGLGTGLHSFAFHPDFLTNGKLYTVHSEAWNRGTPDFMGPTAARNSAGQMSVISEWTTANPSAATFVGTRRELFRVYFPGTIHAAQEVAFNPGATPGAEDYGMLYITMGEGGGYLKGLWQNEHRLDSPMGSVFRIDPLGNNSANGNYGIPEDNPWAEATDGAVIKELYAYGFRNPHRIIWDTGGSGRTYVGDIGEVNIEEVNVIVAGGDYGFPQREGTFVLDPTNPGDNDEVFALPADDAIHGYTYPVAQYDHDEGQAITMGPVYRGVTAPLLDGQLLFGDIVRGRVFLVEESKLSLGSQVPIMEARLTLDGISGTLQSFVGNSRADLRFGTDGNGDVYVMTKTDGKIRRIIGASSASSGFESDPERWQKVADFSESSEVFTATMAASSGSIEVAPDPFGDGVNDVLSIAGPGNRAVVPLPGIPLGAQGSLYFRFALADRESSGFFAAGTSSRLSQASVAGTFAGGGSITVNDASSEVVLSDLLRPGIWYEGWIIFPENTSEYSFYIRGDLWTAPAFLRSGLVTARSVGSGMTQFFWSLTAASGEAAAVFLDDLYVDPAAANLSAPGGARWSVVADFENEGTFDHWTFIDVLGETESTAAVSTASFLTEINGNVALRIATPADGTNVHAYAPLSARIEVSDEVTLYGRTMVEAFNTNQVWGLVNVPEESILSSGFNAYDVIGRWTDENGSNELLIRSGSDYTAASGSYQAGEWYEYWIHVHNGGEASGGQTFDVYTRGEEKSAAPTLVFSEAEFRIAKETPLDFFKITTNNGENGKTGAVLYDDIYVIDGFTLDAPEGTGYGLYPGRREWKQSPWMGSLSTQFYPWVYHPFHGWLYVQANNPKGAWHYDLSLGWLWITPSQYPFIYSASRKEWLYFLDQEGDPRWFYGFVARAWFTVPPS